MAVSDREAELSSAVSRDPNDYESVYDLALLILQRGNPFDAEVHARNAVRLRPRSPQAHHLLGAIFTETQRLTAGEYHFRRALADDRDPLVVANLAWNLVGQGRIAEARLLYGEAIAANPDDFRTLLGLARLEEADRNVDAAEKLIERCLDISPGHGSALLSLAVIQGRRGEYEGALATLAKIPRDAVGPNEWLERGRVLDRLRQYDEAFEAFKIGKELTRRVSKEDYLAERAVELTSALGAFFTSSNMDLLPRAALRPGPQPIFIVGFPRSGTTLVEQALSAHSEIVAAGELSLVNDIAADLSRLLDSGISYPEALSELWMGDRQGDIDVLCDHYLRRAIPKDEGMDTIHFFTDKTPLNEMHLGLIALLFPQSPIVHVIRHPLDVVVSTFANQLTHGYYCGYTLQSAAHHYALLDDLVERYKSELRLNYLAIRYEDIVEDHDASIRKILSFVGVAFEPACARFDRNRRYARTASYAQVTEPLYDRSVYRHRQYAKHLTSVVPILRQSMERLGYDWPGSG